MRIASSCQNVLNSLSARAIFCAIGSRHRLWNSTMMSIGRPPAVADLAKGLQRDIQVGIADVLPVTAFGRRVETARSSWP
jgi:hypothetical protein